MCFVQATSPYLSGVPSVGSTYAQYYAPQLMPMLGHDPAAAAASPLGVMQQPVLQQKLPRTDRLEVGIAFLLLLSSPSPSSAFRCCQSPHLTEADMTFESTLIHHIM